MEVKYPIQYKGRDLYPRSERLFYDPYKTSASPNDELTQIKDELSEVKLLLAEIKKTLIKPNKLSVDVKEAAEMLGVSKSTLYILMTNKELKYSSIGGKKVIRLQELERLLKDQEIYLKRKF